MAAIAQFCDVETTDSGGVAPGALFFQRFSSKRGSTKTRGIVPAYPNIDSSEAEELHRCLNS